jgi:iron complex outermembrane receptor protein
MAHLRITIARSFLENNCADATGLDFEARWTGDGRAQPEADRRLDRPDLRELCGPGRLAGQAVGTPFWSLAGGFNYHWRNVLSGDLNLSVQGAYSGAGRCNADSQAQGSCLSGSATDGARSRG